MSGNGAIPGWGSPQPQDDAPPAPPQSAQPPTPKPNRPIWKSPKAWGIGIAALFVLGAIGSLSKPAPADVPASSAAALVATPAAVAVGSLTITSHRAGDVVDSASIMVSGIAPAGATVVRDVSFGPDEQVVAGADGAWRMEVTLAQGVNELTFRIGDDASTARKIEITYSPIAVVESPAITASPSPTPTPAPTASPTPRVTPAPTPKPTREPTEPPVTYAKLTDRQWAKVVKSPDNYLFDTFDVWACIVQFDAATGTDTFRGQASNRKEDYWYSDGDNAIFTGSEDMLSDFVTDDIVHMHVISLGSYTYDTTIGGSTTVPMFQVVSLSRKGDCS